MSSSVASTLESDNTTSSLVWYCGIGSMMNLTALALREVCPVRSVWCEILDHRRVFYATAGMATLLPEEGSTAHAVAHEITLHELRLLESREPPSMPVRARLRGRGLGGSVVTALVSVSSNFVFLEGVPAKAEHVGKTVRQEGSEARGRVTAASEAGINVGGFGPMEFNSEGRILIDEKYTSVPSRVTRTPPVLAQPSARYVSLMVEGAKDAGMDDVLIAEIANTPCTPRKRKEECLKLRTDHSVAHLRFSATDVEENGYIVFRGMVFRNNGSTLFPNSNFSQGDIAHFWSRQLHDPLHGHPPMHTEQPWEGWAFIEDMVCSVYTDLTHIGWLDAQRASAKL